MDTGEYARMAEYERTYWWHLGRLQIIRTYLRRVSRGRSDLAVLNVGCGTGGTIGTLEEFGKVENVDASAEAVAFVTGTTGRDATVVDGVELPFADRAFDVVGAFDVLEHIDDDRGALLEWSRVLTDDGAVVLTVPAYPWLWSDHDVSLHHRRRYTRRTLLAVAAAAGLRPEKASYAIVFSLPLIVVFRLVNRLRRRGGSSETSYVPVPRAVNAGFTRLLTVEARMHESLSLPAGTSIVAVLRKGGSA